MTSCELVLQLIPCKLSAYEHVVNLEHRRGPLFLGLLVTEKETSRRLRDGLANGGLDNRLDKTAEAPLIAFELLLGVVDDCLPLVVRLGSVLLYARVFVGELVADARPHSDCTRARA